MNSGSQLDAEAEERLKKAILYYLWKNVLTPRSEFDLRVICDREQNGDASDLFCCVIRSLMEEGWIADSPEGPHNHHEADYEPDIPSNYHITTKGVKHLDAARSVEHIDRKDYRDEYVECFGVSLPSQKPDWKVAYFLDVKYRLLNIHTPGQLLTFLVVLAVGLALVMLGLWFSMPFLFAPGVIALVFMLLLVFVYNRRPWVGRDWAENALSFFLFGAFIASSLLLLQSGDLAGNGQGYMLTTATLVLAYVAYVAIHESNEKKQLDIRPALHFLLRKDGDSNAYDLSIKNIGKSEAQFIAIEILPLRIHELVQKNPNFEIHGKWIRIANLAPGEELTLARIPTSEYEEAERRVPEEAERRAGLWAISNCRAIWGKVYDFDSWVRVRPIT